MLKYPNWQQKKNNQSHLYLLSQGEGMVTPYMRRRADSGNTDRQYSQGHDSNRCCLQTSSTTNVKTGGGRQCGRSSICPTAKARKTDWKCYQCSEWVCKDKLCVP